MKIFTFSKHIFLVGLSFLTFQGIAQNLLTNGDFQGAVNTGYQGGQTPYNYIAGPFSGVTGAGDWTINTNPQPVNTASFLSTGDHTTGTGRMMIIDGTNSGGQPRFWRAGTGGTGVCGLNIGTNYRFSYWIRSVFTNANGGTVANVGVQFINAINVTLDSGTTTAPPTASGWQEVVYKFTATNTCVYIEMYNNNTDFVGNDFAIDDMRVIADSTCPVPTVTVTQPTCTVNTGTIVFTSPINTSPLPIPTDLFISEVTDEDVGALTYIEIFNGTGAPKNLANYKLKIYNNGNTFTSCEFPLTGILNNNFVYVVSVGSTVNQGGITPTLVVASCAGINDNDNIRLTTSTDVPIDLWGRTDGVSFTPANQPGYTYRRIDTAPHPSLTWNPADWNALDPQDYTNIGTYAYITNNYEYSINGVNYQASPTFTGVAPGTYYVTVRDIITGCVSISVPVTVDPVPVAPSSPPILFCDGANTTATQVGFDFNSIGQHSFDFTYSIDGGPAVSGTIPFSPSSYFVTGVSQGQAVTLTINWNGVCTTPLTVTCYPTCVTPVTPTFTQVAPICSGQALSPLPTTSNNGVVGTWAPALNNTATTTYTFTPNPGECGTTTTMTIIVNNPVTPTFTQVAAICAGQTLTALPTTSNNGITGTWSPALNNTATTTYTFTPNAGQCAGTTTMTITVNPVITPTFTAVSPICTGQSLSALPTTSNNGITGTWSPALNNTATTTYTFTPTAGQCASTATLTITVNGNTITPTFTAIAPICSGQVLSALPTTSNNGITGTWSPALNNTATTTYTFTPNTGQCATTTTLTITVNPNNIIPTFTSVGPICPGQTLSPLPTTSNNGISGSWSPALNNTATTTYTFTPNSGQCATSTTMQIVVNSTVTPTFTAVPPTCTGTFIAPLPTTSDNGITGTWSPAINNTATTVYTFTPNAGQCAITTTMTITITPRVTPTFTAVAPICSGDVLAPLPTNSNNGISGSWSPALNNTATTTYTFTPSPGACANTTTLQITVVPQVDPVVSVVESCASNTVTVTGPLGPNYEYSIDGGAYQTNTVYYNLAAGNHTITAHEISANCFSNAVNFTINSVVNDVVVTNPPPLQVCDPNNDGFETFNLNTVINIVTGGNPYAVTFHETITDAQTGATPIPTPANYDSINPGSQIIYIRVQSNTTSCFEIVPLQLIANPTPVATEPSDYQLCDYTGAVGYETFDLSSVEPEILGGIDPALTDVTFHTTLADAQNDANAITSETS
ncbi:hypothetical protein QHT84_06330, partial [Flavobacterium sp. YZ-48]|nr:hypothetical protein [Flavobacterium sedimenticola]